MRSSKKTEINDDTSFRTLPSGDQPIEARVFRSIEEIKMPYQGLRDNVINLLRVIPQMVDRLKANRKLSKRADELENLMTPYIQISAVMTRNAEVRRFLDFCEKQPQLEKIGELKEYEFDKFLMNYLNMTNSADYKILFQAIIDASINEAAIKEILRQLPAEESRFTSNISGNVSLQALLSQPYQSSARFILPVKQILDELSKVGNDAELSEQMSHTKHLCGQIHDSIKPLTALVETKLNEAEPLQNQESKQKKFHKNKKTARQNQIGGSSPSSANEDNKQQKKPASTPARMLFFSGSSKSDNKGPEVPPKNTHGPNRK